MDNKKYAIIGLGVSGVSTARFLKQNNNQVILLDSNAAPSNIDAILSLNLQEQLFLGLDKADIIKKIENYNPDEIVLSPGCVINFLDDLLALNFKITCDVELFIKYIKKNFKSQVIGITGTNGKSTTTALTHYLLKANHYNTYLGGNYGIPVFDLLDNEITKDTVFVLELSSFQLEISHNLELDAAVILNLAPDHLDRYKNLDDYYQAKYSVYDNAKNKLVNKDQDVLGLFEDEITFSKGDVTTDFYIKDEYIYYKSNKLLNIGLIQLFGEHNKSNALASLALIFSIISEKKPRFKNKKINQYSK